MAASQADGASCRPGAHAGWSIVEGANTSIPSMGATSPSTSPARGTSKAEGDDHVPYLGDPSPILDAVEDFVTGGAAAP
jgi:hypothetical protein